MFTFQKIWRALFSCNTLFEIHPFALLPMNFLSPKSKVTHASVYIIADHAFSKYTKFSDKIIYLTP